MTQIDFQEVQSILSEALGQPCPMSHTVHNEPAIEIPAESLHHAVQTLAQTRDIRHLTAITVQNDPSTPKTLSVRYHFWEGTGFHLSLHLAADHPELPTIIDLIPGADFYEREAAEMFGIRFTGRETTPPLLLPDDWEGAPPMIAKEEN